ncbi:hypothetical protein VTN77DRAFT_3725 [Rasamsonia byssochlamydoides]|uniref:uncharacterized protein n=1 Tax=Rasamsonia byssochlamydoides TaxID=89139 RepID=UPI003742D3F4
MAECPSENSRRASLAMYDPARDIYTVSEEQDLDRSAERDARHQGEKRDTDHVGASAHPPGQQTDAAANLINASTTIAPHSTPQEAIEGSAEQSESSNQPPASASAVSRDHSPSEQARKSFRLHTPSVKPDHFESSHLEAQPVHPPGAMPEQSDTLESDQSQIPSSIEARHEVDSPATESRNNGVADETQTPDGTSNEKKRKLTEEEPASDKPRLASSKRKRQEERHLKLRKRGPTPPSAYSRRDRSRSPIRHDQTRDSRSVSPRRSPSPLPRERSPTPEAQARQRKRPGGGARLGTAGKEALRRRQEERERAQQEEVERALRDRGVADVVRQHYNAVPERGREWRKTDSKIKGLRSFNNWVKSTLIQKFSPDEEFLSRMSGTKDWAESVGPPPIEEKRLLVVDLGCGKGGDLGKWQLAPQPVDLYVGLDPAEVSIEQARERYNGMRNGRGPRGRRGNRLFHAEFYPKDCFGEWLGDIRIIQQVGIDPNVGPNGSLMSSRWGGGGFDVVASMFAMHYAFESEEKARQMLQNVAGLLKKGGRFLGVGPNSDVISAKVVEFHQRRKAREEAKKQGQAEAPEDGEVEEETPEWGNSIYRVRFPGATPEDGVFRPPFGWKYSYYMEEAVEGIPEYVVPWEAFRALTQEYNLELQYRKPFLDVWKEEKDDPELGPLSERMGVRARGGGPLLVTDEELEAASFYHAFCFYKV